MPSDSDDRPVSERHSVEDVLSFQRDVITHLLRSPALGHGDVDTALLLATEAASRLLGVRRASVWRFDPARTRIDCLDLFDAETGEHARGLALFQADAPAYFAAALQERCIVAHDAREDPRTRAFTESYFIPNDITALLDAPVLVRGELVGVVCHEHVGSKRTWLHRDELLAGTLADFVGMALSAAEHAAQAGELSALRDGLERLVEERTQELSDSRESFRALFEGSPVAMLLASIGEGVVREANRRAGEMFGVGADALRGSRAADLWVEPRELDELLGSARESGRIEGVDCQLHKSGGSTFWGSASVSVLTFERELAVLLSIQDITDKKRHEEQLRKLATTDGLTGLVNHRHLFEVGGPMVDLAERHGRALTVAMIDVDHFKGINDRYGHATGDQALRLLAEQCRAALRKSDVLARYGGEEFVILFPETGGEPAREAVERIRSSLRHATVTPTEGDPFTIAVSAGVAERKAGESLGEVLRRADEALYAAKRGGRDRVVVA